MRKPYLSIIIPAYNASETLVRLLASLDTSTYTNFEVIVGDDASNEQLTVNNLRGSKKKHTFPLRVIRLTRNRGRRQPGTPQRSWLAELSWYFWMQM